MCIRDRSIGWRAGQVLLIGVPAGALDLWQKLVIAAILFHHSNLRLPIDLERALVQGIVTPRMHGVHHSVVRAEADSNWSTILSVWDRLHGTLRLNVPQDEIEIGVPAFRTPDQLGLLQFLTIPLVASGRDLELADATHQYRAR